MRQVIFYLLLQEGATSVILLGSFLSMMGLRLGHHLAGRLALHGLPW
jgi:hypothetical protein